MVEITFSNRDEDIWWEAIESTSRCFIDAVGLGSACLCGLLGAEIDMGFTGTVPVEYNIAVNTPADR